MLETNMKSFDESVGTTDIIFGTQNKNNSGKQINNIIQDSQLGIRCVYRLTKVSVPAESHKIAADMTYIFI